MECLGIDTYDHSCRYDLGLLLVTSNLPFSRWQEAFKYLMTTVATIDRLVYHSIIQELNVESYWVQAAKSRVGQRKAEENHERKNA